MKTVVDYRSIHGLLLCTWIVIGAGLRFTHLASKPPWTDEFATLVFSLGHSFETIPLDQIISLNELLQPLQLPPSAGVQDVVHHLLTEDVHPPLYFVLCHWWLQLLSPPNGFVSLEIARSLPALLGVLTIPATFGLSWLAFRSLVAGQLAAAAMAVSPYAIYLSQEARHYTCGMLWVIAILACLIVATRAINQRLPLSIRLSLMWVGCNGLGIATHYFIMLTLIASALVLLSLGIIHFKQEHRSLWQHHWQRIYAIALGTTATGLIWLPIWQSLRDRDITQWIQSSDRLNLLALINPIVQSLAAWVTMIVLFPVESTFVPVILLSGLGMILYLVWAIPILKRGLSNQLTNPHYRLSIQVLGGFVLGAIVLFFLIAYGLGSDITRGARYNFVYFPAVPVLIGISLASLWTSSGSFAQKRSVAVIGLVGLASSITIVSNLGYQKYYRPEILTSFMQRYSQQPIVIATTHNTLVQTGELMGIGWQVRDLNAAIGPISSPQFLLAHQSQASCLRNCHATQVLQDAIAQQTAPTDLWLVNFNAPVNMDGNRCKADGRSLPYINGYHAQLYHCLNQ